MNTPATIKPFDHIYQNAADGARFIQFRYFGDVFNLELLEGDDAADAIATAHDAHLRQVGGVPFYVCSDDFGAVFALASAPHAGGVLPT
jgi:hypothetical protein